MTLNLQSTVGRAFEELFEYICVKVEEVGLELASLVPALFHKLIIDLWMGFKLFIQDCLELLDIFFVHVQQESQLHHPDIHNRVAPLIITVTANTRYNAYRLEAKREKVVKTLMKFFKLWKETMCTVEKELIHPTVGLAAQTTKHYYAKVVAISEPAIEITQPVWNPIMHKVYEVNGRVVESPIIGHLVGKMEHMVNGAVESVVAYCNNTEEMAAL